MGFFKVLTPEICQHYNKNRLAGTKRITAHQIENKMIDLFKIIASNAFKVKFDQQSIPDEWVVCAYQPVLNNLHLAELKGINPFQHLALKISAEEKWNAKSNAF